MQIAIGVEVSLDNVTWYKLSDHNRQPIGINYDLIEQTQRMANGTLRKYIIARKFKITTDWQNFPTLDSNLVDYKSSLGDVPGNAHAGAWIKAFYEANAFNPMYVKLIFAQETIPAEGSVPSSSTYVDSKNSTGQIYNAYMTSFTYDILKRRSYNTTSSTNSGYDYVNLKIEFTEI
jgi:hypothetical protein